MYFLSGNEHQEETMINRAKTIIKSKLGRPSLNDIVTVDIEIITKWKHCICND